MQCSSVAINAFFIDLELGTLVRRAGILLLMEAELADGTDAFPEPLLSVYLGATQPGHRQAELAAWTSV